MNKLVRYAAVLLFASLVAPSTFADEALDALEKKLVAQWSKIESVSTKISMSMEMQGMSQKGEGVMEAAFDGDHGWFWRNRTTANVQLTLWTSGVYLDFKRVL